MTVGAEYAIMDMKNRNPEDGMEKIDREKALAAREKLPLYWAAIAANLVPFALCFALI